MDLPWNPAVLQQRAGRIHRMGQQRPVRVVNFVAKGTIEEGMLSVLAFKRSLSAGVLDGEAGEISLGDSRLNRFMKEVENVTARMGESEAIGPLEEAATAGGAPAGSMRETSDPDESPGRRRAGSTAGIAAQQAAEPPLGQSVADPWTALLRIGTQFASALAAVGDPDAAPHPWIRHDAAAGTQTLELPLPSPQLARQLAGALSAIADSLRGTPVPAKPREPGTRAGQLRNPAE